jgi:hypothetical protein
MIDAIGIDNFRGFAMSFPELRSLRRVNLIVGKNNAGKTSLLEALFLLCAPTRIPELPGLFRPHQGDSDLRFFRWLRRDGAKQSETNLGLRATDATRRTILIVIAFLVVGSIDLRP